MHHSKNRSELKEQRRKWVINALHENNELPGNFGRHCYHGPKAQEKLDACFEKLDEPEFVGYQIDVKAKVDEPGLQEALEALWDPIISSGPDFRKCDIKNFHKNGYWKAHQDEKLSRLFDKSKRLRIEELEVRTSFRNWEYHIWERLSPEAQKFFFPIGIKDKFGRSDMCFAHKLNPENLYTFEVHKRFRYYRFVPPSEDISRSEYLSYKLFTEKRFYKDFFYGESQYFKGYPRYKNKQLRKQQKLELKDIENHLQEVFNDGNVDY